MKKLKKISEMGGCSIPQNQLSAIKGGYKQIVADTYKDCYLITEPSSSYVTGDVKHQRHFDDGTSSPETIYPNPV